MVWESTTAAASASGSSPSLAAAICHGAAITPLPQRTGLLAEPDAPTFTVVDFHAQATSEKLAMAYYLDGRVSALWGTHTHVPTADQRVFPKGTGYLTDLGMTGAVESVLGIPAPAVGGDVLRRSAGPFPPCLRPLQGSGGALHAGQRHGPVYGSGAGGYPLSTTFAT